MADNHAQDHYDNIATQYDSIETLPHSHLTQDLVKYALGDCTGQIILDVGGGSGLHARNAVAHGAARVDNVDLSPGLLRNCDAAEKRAGRKPGERVRCFLGDATRSLDDLGLPGRDGGGLYDVVMVIWTFDHASSISELEGMWCNVARHCRPGGKVISIRTNNPFQHHSSTTKYGVTISDVQAVPGGASYVYTANTNMPFSCKATAIEAHYDLDKTRMIARRLGFGHLNVVTTAEIPVVREQSAYWRDFLDHPGFCCIVGTKEES